MHSAHRAVRLRFGLGLWLASWLPFPVAILGLARALGANPSSSASHEFLVAAYAVQIAIGLVGVGVAGKETIQVVTEHGWRHTPSVVWRTARSGTVDVTAAADRTKTAIDDRPAPEI